MIPTPVQGRSGSLPTVDTDFEVRSLDQICINDSQIAQPWWYNLKYALVGLAFGIIFVKAESFHGSASRKCFASRASICLV